jgi:hypothetical protein
MEYSISLSYIILYHQLIIKLIPYHIFYIILCCIVLYCGAAVIIIYCWYYTACCFRIIVACHFILLIQYCFIIHHSVRIIKFHSSSMYILHVVAKIMYKITGRMNQSNLNIVGSSFCFIIQRLKKGTIQPPPSITRTLLHCK